MIGPDGTVFPNHHRYVEVRPEERIAYTLLWGENGPKHTDAWAFFEDQDGATKVVPGHGVQHGSRVPSEERWFILYYSSIKVIIYPLLRDVLKFIVD